MKSSNPSTRRLGPSGGVFLARAATTTASILCKHSLQAFSAFSKRRALAKPESNKKIRFLQLLPNGS